MDFSLPCAGEMFSPAPGGEKESVQTVRGWVGGAAVQMCCGCVGGGDTFSCCRRGFSFRGHVFLLWALLFSWRACFPAVGVTFCVEGIFPALGVTFCLECTFFLAAGMVFPLMVFFRALGVTFYLEGMCSCSVRDFLLRGHAFILALRWCLP